jgi:RNA polymerase subunit RPABC4/transcription elongation factor Spt4
VEKDLNQRAFHGPITPADLANALVAELDQGNLKAQMIGSDDNLVVQVASPIIPASGGRTAISVHLSKIEDGVLVRLGQQQWLGVAASLGTTALAAVRNPFSLLGRLDDIAQDIASLQLTARIWQTVERAAENLGASYELSERLRRLTCDHCDTANPVGEPSCIACGAPLGPDQPIACSNCGNVVRQSESKCPQCGHPLH